MPDLAGPGQFVTGDPLLQANEKLAVALDGVYHRGEVYLRGLQRLSSLFFGTRPGRFLTLYLILPLLGAFLLLEGLQYVFDETGLWHLFVPNRFTPVEVASTVGLAADPNGMGPIVAGSTLRAVRHHKPHLLSVWSPPYSLPVTALFLFALMHFPRFRRGFVAGLRGAWHLVRSVLWDTPRAILSPLVASGVFQFVWQVLLKPALYAVPLIGVLHLAHVPWQELRWAAASIFGFFCLLLNTRVGARLEEALVDSLAALGRWLGRDALPALFNLVMAFFKQLVERIDRLIYAVDEQLRFREGDSRLSLVGKALTGVVWGAVTYVVRFAVNLLIEPQVNPIKHFPVVTVSHKLMLTLVPTLAEMVAPRFHLDMPLAVFVTTAVLACIPGLFGFLAWELKENWRLYRANAAPELQPKAIGSHGETVLRLLRPGFHSGTLPRIFARLRRAERAGDRKGTGRRLADLHHVQEAVRPLRGAAVWWPSWRAVSAGRPCRWRSGRSEPASTTSALLWTAQRWANAPWCSTSRTRQGISWLGWSSPVGSTGCRQRRAPRWPTPWSASTNKPGSTWFASRFKPSCPKAPTGSSRRRGSLSAPPRARKPSTSSPRRGNCAPLRRTAARHQGYGRCQ